MKSWQTRLVFIFVLAVAFVVWIAVGLNPIGPEEKQQGELLKKFTSELQPFPGAKPGSEDFSYDVNQASFSTYYDTPEDFKKVAEFYHPQLTTQGWVYETQVSDDSRHYRKGPYQLIVSAAKHRTRGYSLSFTWNRP